jgi:purine-nucleoside phosphorylase
MTADPYAAAVSAAAELASRTGVASHDVAVVLGSGWLPAADALGPAIAEVAVTDLGGFPAPTVAGHVGSVRSVQIGRLRVLVYLGRVHLYEGHSPSVVVHGVRTAAAAGCRTIVLTNAAGGISPGFTIGQPVLIRDHLNLTARSPLGGAPPPADLPARVADLPARFADLPARFVDLPARFVDLSDLYSARLRRLARAEDPSLAEGVYAALPGPHYETPAEIAMLRGFGADLVGMSTALEAIAACHLGVEVLGLSLVTNMAAGLGSGAVEHEEVIATGASSAAAVGALLARILQSL